MSTEYVLVLLAGLASLALPEDRARRTGLAGTLVAAIAAASLGHIAAPAGPPGALTPAFAAITAGHLLLALGLLVTATLQSRRHPGPPAWVSLVLMTPALVAGLLVAARLIGVGGWFASIAAGTALAGGVLVARPVAHALRLAQGVTWLDRALFDRATPAAGAWRLRARWLAVAQAAAATGALVAVHLDVAMAAVLVTVGTGALSERDRRPGRWGWLLASLVCLLPLAVAWGLLVRVAGPTPHWLDDLREAPYSPAFETLTSLLLLLAAWPLLGLWPAHGTGLGPVAPLGGAALLGRIAAPILPLGVQHWQPVVYLLASLAVWHGVARERAAGVLAGLSVIGAASLDAAATWPALGLAGAAALAELRAGRAGRPGGTAARSRWLPYLWLVPLVLVPPVIQAGLAAETIYTVLAAWGAVAAASRVR